MPSKTVPRYKVIHCKTCKGVIYRFDRSAYKGYHIPVEEIMSKTRQHYKEHHPRKFKESIIKGVRKRMGLPVKNLLCPVCQESNPVSKVNTRLKCSGCGTNLISVKVKKHIKGK